MFAERRKYKRVQANIDVQVELIFPEQTFRPEKKGGLMLNIGERGMKIRMLDIPLSFYRKFLSAVRYAKVSFTLPTINKHMVLHGKMVWLDYDSPKEECPLGIYFETIAHEDQHKMHDFIEEIER